MGQKKMTPYMRGYVTVELIGGNVSALINNAQAAGIAVWEIAWQKNGHAVCSLFVRDVWRFRKIARSAGVRFRILHKYGMPFMFVRLNKRRYFALGFVVFIIGLIVASNVVWDVDVEGNETIPEKEVLRLAREAGVYEGQFQFRMKDNDTIQRQLLLGLSDASWVGIRIQGTRAIITIVEKRRIDTGEQMQDDSGPYDLVANRTATIVDLSGVETGKIVVDYNETVRKGQKLVSGFYGDGEKDTKKLIGARGAVIGETWYETMVSVPLTQTRKTYTGERDVTIYPYIGHWTIHIPLLEKVPYEQFETVEHIQKLHFRNWVLPFGLVKKEYLESRKVKVVRTEETAKQLAIERAKQDVHQKIGPHGKIKAMKILHKEVNGGKVVLKILFTVREDIAERKPIIVEKSEDDT